VPTPQNGLTATAKNFYIGKFLARKRFDNCQILDPHSNYYYVEDGYRLIFFTLPYPSFWFCLTLSVSLFFSSLIPFRGACSIPSI